MADVPLVLKEGYLKKRSRSNALILNWRRRYFRLYPGMLYYFASIHDTVERRQMVLSLDTVVTQTNDQGYMCCLVVKSSPTAENFYLQAENEEEKLAWTTAIYEAARRTPDVSAEEPAPRETPASSSVPPPAPAATLPSRVLLSLTVEEARNLMSADFNGKSDPYCVINLVDKNGEIIRSEEMKTNYITDTLNPKWKKQFTIGNAVDLHMVAAIQFELWDHDHISRNSSLGFVRVPLSVFRMSPASTAHSEPVDNWFRVEPPETKSTSPRNEKQDKEVMTRDHGELHLVMSVSGPNLVNFFRSSHFSVVPQSRTVVAGMDHTDNRLEVTVLAAKDLIIADLNKSSDPYCELSLIDYNLKPIRGEHFTTKIKYETRNPSWENEHHVLGMICHIEEASHLKVRVLDYDRHSKNDPLGYVQIDLDELSAHHMTNWYPLLPEPSMTSRENLGSIRLKLSLIGESRGERNRRKKIDKEVTSKHHEQSMEQLELENAQHQLHDAICKLDGARIPCAVDDYQVRHPRFYGINGCIHHLNTQIPRAHRETTSSDENFQARAGIEGQAVLEVTVVGTSDLPKVDVLTTSNPFAVVEVNPKLCVEACKRTSAPLNPQKNKRIEALNNAAAESRNALFSKRVTAEVASHRTKLTKNETRSENHIQIDSDRPVLRVEIMSGHGLSGVDIGGYSDPYCTLSITDRATGKLVENEKKKTAIISKTLNPVWSNEVFIFGKVSYCIRICYCCKGLTCVV